MSTQSLGFLFRLKHPPQCLHLHLDLRLPKRPHPTQTHHFTTTSSSLRPPIKKRPPPPHPAKPPHHPPSNTTSSPPLTYQSYASTLAQKPYPTLLYTAPSHGFYTLSCYSAATFCLTYAAYNFYSHSLHPPPGLAPWVPIAFGGVCFLMTCFGGWLMLGPARLISSITAMPAASYSTAAAAAKKSAVVKTAPASLRLEIELRKMLPLPGFPARKLVVRPEDVGIHTRLYHPPEETRMSAAERVEMRRRLESEHRERMSRLMTLPFRDAKRAFGQAFRALGRVWSREGFMRLTVKGQAYKLDVSGGWALDEGRALDRLVKVKP